MIRSLVDYRNGVLELKGLISKRPEIGSSAYNRMEEISLAIDKFAKDNGIVSQITLEDVYADMNE